MTKAFRLLTALLLAPTLAPAAPPITVAAAWARATPPGVTTAAAYLTVTNDGAAADRLLGAVSPAARQVLLHSEVEEHGMQHMRQLEGVEVPAHGSVELAAGKMHLMLVDIAAALVPDTTIKMTLRFEKAGEITIDVPVRDGRVPVEHHHH